MNCICFCCEWKTIKKNPYREWEVRFKENGDKLIWYERK